MKTKVRVLVIIMLMICCINSILAQQIDSLQNTQITSNEAIETEMKNIQYSYITLEEAKKLLSDSLSVFQKSWKNAANEKKREYDQKILKQQVKAVGLCCHLNQKLSFSAKTIDLIFDAMSFGIDLGKATSPYVSHTFTQTYDKWYDEVVNFAPAIAGSLLPVLFNKMDDKWKTGSMTIGLSVSGVVMAINGWLKSKKAEEHQNSLRNLSNAVNMIELFEFNRDIYNDIQKIQSMIKSVNAADSLLGTEYEKFYDEYCKKIEEREISEASMPKYEHFHEIIEKSIPYFDRFDERLARANVVLDYIKSVLDTYTLKYAYLSKIEAYKGNPMLIEAYEYIKRMSEKRETHRDRWDALQKQMRVTPEQSRNLQLFYDYEKLKFADE
jgi:hypothetical protein